VTPAADRERLGSCSCTASASSSAEGIPLPHFTRRSVMRQGRTPGSSSVAKLDLKSFTDCCRSTAFCEEYCPSNFTQIVESAADSACDGTVSEATRRAQDVSASDQSNTARTHHR